MGTQPRNLPVRSRNLFTPGELLMEVGLLVKKDSPIKGFKDLEKKKNWDSQHFRESTNAGILLGIKANHGNPSTAQIVVVPSAQASAALQRGRCGCDSHR